MSGAQNVQFDLSTGGSALLGRHVTKLHSAPIKAFFAESLEGSAKSILSTLRFQAGAESKIEIRQCTLQTGNLEMIMRHNVLYYLWYVQGPRSCRNAQFATRVLLQVFARSPRAGIPSAPHILPAFRGRETRSVFNFIKRLECGSSIHATYLMKRVRRDVTTQ